MTLTAGEPKAIRAEAPGRPPQRPRRERTLRAIEDAQGWLLAAQEPDGHWCGELEGDTILESEYVLLIPFLGRRDDPRSQGGPLLCAQQLPDGGWSIYPGGPPEVSASVKAYFVLKLAGDDPDAPHMRAPATVILRWAARAATASRSSTWRCSASFA